LSANECAKKHPNVYYQKSLSYVKYLLQYHPHFRQPRFAASTITAQHSTTSISHKTFNMNSCTRTLEAASRCNNQGAHLLKAGNLLGAIHTFRHGIEILQSEGVIHKFADDEQMQVKDESIRECHVYSDGQFFIFSQPLWLPTNLLAVTSMHADTAGLFTLVSTHLIFNLALSCHLLGQETGHSAPLDRALELYHIVLLSSGHSLASRPATVAKSFRPRSCNA
jgi:hypothetical protein